MDFDLLYDDRALPAEPALMGVEGFGADRRSRARRDGRLPSCNYRAGTESARVRDWVVGRAERSWFGIEDVPASPGVAAKVLCEMAARGEVVERVVNGALAKRPGLAAVIAGGG